MATQPESSGQRQPKVQIPRLVGRPSPPKKPAATRQGRVSRACLNCRARKIRCNGETPTCQHCRENAIRCEYATSRRDRLKIATDHNSEMLQLLKELRINLDDAERLKIDEVIARVNDDIADAASALQKDSTRPQLTPKESGEAGTSAEVGSNEDIDTMDEDLINNEHSRATGYLGKQSTVQWLRRAHHEADERSQGSNHGEGPYGPPGKGEEATALRAEAQKQRQLNHPEPLLHTNICSYYLDEETVDMDFFVEPFDLPPRETAECLVKCFMETVQSSYPIISRRTFIDKFYGHYESLARGVQYQVTPKWQATLNLVFAIGAVYSHLSGASWRGDERDHFLYHARAWALSLKDPWWFTHPDLPQTEITGLLALYYLCIGHVNRAWVIIGMAVRFGVSLGLHIRNDDRTASATRKETLARTWWALYSLERTLCSITGRPSVGAEAFCSVALPLPISDDDIDEAKMRALFGERPQDGRLPASSLQGASSASSPNQPYVQSLEPANSGSYLAGTVKLGHLVQRVLSNIYSPETISLSWKEVQERMLTMEDDLETWRAQVPQAFEIYGGHASDQTMRTERDMLRIYYYSAKVLIARPCLCRIDRRIKNQTQVSNDLNMRMAASCVGAAKAIATLLPDDMSDNGRRIYRVFPWWAAVHYIMQSLAVLMLELAGDSAEGKEEEDSMEVIKTLICWLRALKRNNGMARRAYTIAFDLLVNVARVTSIDVSDFLAEHKVDVEKLNSSRSIPSDVLLPPFRSHAEPFEQYTFPTHGPPLDFMWQQEEVGVGPSLPQFDQDTLQSQSPFANFFQTGFDQVNPLPFGDQGADTLMTENLDRGADEGPSDL